MEVQNRLNWEVIGKHFHPSWHSKIRPFIESEACWNISKHLKEEKARGRVILPEGNRIFRAFTEVDLNNLKVVFLGLSPYPQRGIADGLAFSCSISQREQPSLKLLLNAIEDNTKQEFEKRPTDLSFLSRQGVLLLNSALTVEEHKPDKHLELWRPFIEYLYSNIFCFHSGLMFIYFGKEASKYAKKETPFIHYSKIVEHPAYSSRQNREFKHENLFTWCNKLIKEANGSEFEINWIKEPVKKEIVINDQLPWDTEENA